MRVSDLAHLGPVEMFTPEGDASLAFFVEIMGMEIEAQDGPSTYLRGAHDYPRWSLKLTADYSFSKNLTAIFYYDHSFSKAVISTAFPITNIRTGFTLRYNFGN